MCIKGVQKSPIFKNTFYCYYIPFKDNLGIIFPKFEVSSINDGCHWGKWSLADPFKMENFKVKNHQFWHQIWVDREKVQYGSVFLFWKFRREVPRNCIWRYEKWVSLRTLELSTFYTFKCIFEALPEGIFKKETHFHIVLL